MAFSLDSKVKDILKNPDSRDSDRINIAKDFLDRAGFRPQERSESQQFVHPLISDLMEELKRRNG